MTRQLKPCPACGHAATDPTRRTFHACSNHECTLIGPGDDDDGAKWNALPRRSDIDRLTAKLAECREVLRDREFNREETTNYGLRQTWHCGECGADEAAPGKLNNSHAPNCPWLRAMTDEEPKP